MTSQAVRARFGRRPLLRGLVRLAAGLAGIAVAVAAAGATAHAQGRPEQVADTVGATIGDWVRQNDVEAASLAVMKDGRIIKSFGYGGMDAATPARVASLSKAITGVCIARLVDEGRLSFTAPLGAVLGSVFQKFGPPVDPRFKAITIGQLLTHRAGLAREAQRGPRAHDLADIFRRTLATPLVDAPGGPMAYSNIGYLTLGMVVEAVTGADYERHCRAAALTPMKASGAIDPALRHRAPSGGWRISAIDYAKFIQVFEADAGVLGARARQWLDSRHERPAYGLGMGMRRTGRGIVYAHSGKIASAERPGGAYVTKFDNGWTTVVTFEGRPSGHAPNLRNRLEAVVSGR